MKRNMRVLVGAVLIALAPLAQAQTAVDSQVSALDTVGANRGQTLVAGKIASNFGTLAGSEENALALVNALRTGETVKLTYPAPEPAPGTGTGTGSTPAPSPTVTTIDPPTARMGWGNVKISLALAQDVLARAGITNPTGEQLMAALNGGDITVTNADGTTTTTTLKGVLQMRADGMGWGEIAKASGTKMGPVVSQLKMANAKVRALPPTDGTASAATPPAGKSLTTAAGGSPATPKSKGITTATGTGATAGGKHGSKGITTATGAAGSHGSKGIVTAGGAISSSGPKGNASGRGVVTAAGGSATNVASTGKAHGHGAGLVNASGGSASGVTTAAGNAGGNGKGHANGKGRGGG
jgi:hypothetical protein